MAVWGKYILTDVGKEMLMNMLANSQDGQITRLAISSKNLSQEDVKTLYALPEERQSFGIISSRVKNGTLVITAEINNYGLQSSYVMRAVGIYCQDISSKKETLLAVSIAENPDTISAWGGHQVDRINCKFTLSLSDTTNVTVKVDPNAYVRNKELYNLVYPVGSIVLTDGTWRPEDKFGGEWEKLHGYIMASGTYNNREIEAMETGGEEYHEITKREMPEHSHTRGTMNITGSFWADDSVYNAWYGPLKGAFEKGEYIGRGDHDSSGGGYNSGQVAFEAKNTWSGSTSTEGGGVPMQLVPKSIAVDAWCRTKLAELD